MNEITSEIAMELEGPKVKNATVKYLREEPEREKSYKSGRTGEEKGTRPEGEQSGKPSTEKYFGETGIRGEIRFSRN